MSGTAIPHDAVLAHVLYAVRYWPSASARLCSSDLTQCVSSARAHAARCPVLTSRMVLPGACVAQAPLGQHRVEPPYRHRVRVKCLGGFRVRGLGLRVKGLGCRV
eukprot:3939948-Rhodomonas_salina.3